MAKGLHHITLLTKDMNRTIKFYTEVLGLGLIRIGRDKEDETSRVYYFNFGVGTLLAFQDFPGYFGGSPKLRGGMLHLSMELESEEKLTELRDRLIEEGVRVSEVLSESFYQYISFHDNNGFKLQALYKFRELDDMDLFSDTEPPRNVNAYLKTKFSK